MRRDHQWGHRCWNGAALAARWLPPSACSWSNSWGHARVKAVSRQGGHASAMTTLTVHQHVHPGMGRQAAERFAALLEGRSGSRSITGVSRGPQEPLHANAPGS